MLDVWTFSTLTPRKTTESFQSNYSTQKESVCFKELQDFSDSFTAPLIQAKDCMRPVDDALVECVEHVVAEAVEMINSAANITTRIYQMAHQCWATWVFIHRLVKSETNFCGTNFCCHVSTFTEETGSLFLLLATLEEWLPSLCPGVCSLWAVFRHLAETQWQKLQGDQVIEYIFDRSNQCI